MLARQCLVRLYDILPRYAVYTDNLIYMKCLEAVGYSKQKKIISVARHYLMKHGLDEWTPCRFDVIAVDDDEVTVLKNAFEGSQ